MNYNKSPWQLQGVIVKAKEKAPPPGKVAALSQTIHAIIIDTFRQEFKQLCKRSGRLTNGDRPFRVVLFYNTMFPEKYKEFSGLGGDIHAKY